MKADNRPPPSTPLSTSPLPGIHIVLKTPPLEGLPPEEEWITPMTVQVTWHSFLPQRPGRKEDISFKNFTLSVGRRLWPRQGQLRKPTPVDKQPRGSEEETRSNRPACWLHQGHWSHHLSQQPAILPARNQTPRLPGRGPFCTSMSPSLLQIRAQLWHSKVTPAKSLLLFLHQITAEHLGRGGAEGTGGEPEAQGQIRGPLSMKEPQKALLTPRQL